MKVTINYLDGTQEVIEDVIDHIDLPEMFVLKMKFDVCSKNLIQLDKNKLKSVKFSEFVPKKQRKIHKKYR